MVRTIHRCTPTTQTPVLGFTIKVTVGYCNLNRHNAKGNITTFFYLWTYLADDTGLLFGVTVAYVQNNLPYLAYQYLPDCSRKKGHYPNIDRPNNKLHPSLRV